VRAALLALAGTGTEAGGAGLSLCLRLPAGGNFGFAGLIKRAPVQKRGVLASERPRTRLAAHNPPIHFRESKTAACSPPFFGAIFIVFLFVVRQPVP
jgi:hypothetical protein